MVAYLKFENGLVIHPTVYNGRNYLPMLVSKVIHVSKMGPRYSGDNFHKKYTFAVIRISGPHITANAVAHSHEYHQRKFRGVHSHIFFL